jgi:hypothetical protein
MAYGVFRAPPQRQGPRGGSLRQAWIGTAGAAAPGTNFTQVTFRGRNDDGSEVLATWKAAAGVDWNQVEDETFRVRFGVSVV